MAKAKRKRATRRATHKPAESNGHIKDGTITVAVEGGPHDGKTLSMDAMVVKLIADELVETHDLTIDNGKYIATAGFAVDLDNALQKIGYTSTPTIAVFAWVAACDYFAEIQKKTS